jgi:signal recognition particle subunit SRP54
MAFDKLKDSIRSFAGRSLADEEAIEELVKDIQRALLRADADVQMVQELSDEIKQAAMKKDIPSGLTRKEHVLNIVYEQLADFLGEAAADVDLQPQRILLLGLFGAGKTTTAGKLANFFRKRGLQPGLIAADVHRPAAYEQLEQNADEVNAAFYGEPDNDDAAAIVRNGVRELTEVDVVIVDSAGRDSMNAELQQELEDIEQALQPDNAYLVIPADIGQAAREQAETFNDAVGIDGVIVTKMDSSAKGGGALSSTAAASAPVTFLGTGEGMDDLDLYDPEDFVGDLLGEPDIGAIVEKAEEAIDTEAAEKFMEGEFTMEDFFEQLESVSSSGMMDQLLDQMPFSKDKLPDNMMEMQEEKMQTYKAAMNSMTPEEKQDPKVVDKSRADRIAKGAGIERGDVREMIKQYRQAKNMMDKMGGKNMKRGNMRKMMEQFGF